MIKVIKITFLLASIILFFVISRYLGNLYAADECFSDATRLLSEGEIDRALHYADKAISLNPKEPNYYRSRARAYLAKLAISYSEDKRITLKLLALADMEKAFDLNGRNIVTVRNLIPLYYFVGIKDITLPISADNVDVKFLPFVREFYSKVQNISSTDVGIYILLAKYQKRLGFEDQYEYSVEKVRQLRPDLLEWYFTE